MFKRHTIRDESDFQRSREETLGDFRKIVAPVRQPAPVPDCSPKRRDALADPLRPPRAPTEP
jgi:hypothetical protein